MYTILPALSRSSTCGQLVGPGYRSHSSLESARTATPFAQTLYQPGPLPLAAASGVPTVTKVVPATSSPVAAADARRAKRDMVMSDPPCDDPSLSATGTPRRCQAGEYSAKPFTAGLTPCAVEQVAAECGQFVPDRRPGSARGDQTGITEYGGLLARCGQGDLAELRDLARGLAVADHGQRLCSGPAQQSSERADRSRGRAPVEVAGRGSRREHQHLG